MASPFLKVDGKLLTLLLASLCCASIAGGNAQAGPDIKAQPVPVLVELFTSEGCSDCPPADALLAELDAKQFVRGAEAIVLSEHVTYWNHLGWRDPFSLDAVTLRQEEYVRRFGLDSAYTPQAVVDGRSQFVGSDRRALTAAISRAATTPKIRLAIEKALWDHGVVRFTVRGEMPKHSKLMAVLASNATHSEVARGENAGRTLHHTAVVRAAKVFSGDAVDGRSLELAAGPLSEASESNGPVRLVVFVADAGDGQVRGAAQQMLSR